jgi:hypothetical protein
MTTLEDTVRHVSNSVIDLALPHPRSAGPAPIATLGPSGTSSEAAAGYLADYLLATWPDVRAFDGQFPIQLHDRYEMAADSVRAGDSHLLLVANAYHNASTFYMDPSLQILGAFVFDTPRYGLATVSASPPLGSVRVACHPATIALIDQLVSRNVFEVKEVVRCDSTSAAAATVASGHVDVALTTEPARRRYGLHFVSATRQIRMLWSVFGANLQRPRIQVQAS